MHRALLVIAILSTLSCASEKSVAPPNVVLIMADDQGWGDLSVHGNSNLSTPHIDSLARDGAKFERFYVSPVCSPTRAELLTGRYHPRGGVYGTSAGSERLNLDERTIAETFHAAGYATGAFGKWHNGGQHPYHPNSRGFDEFYGFTSGHWGHYFDTAMDHNGEFVRGKGFIIDDLTDHAISFIDQNSANPFFCYIPYNTPHSPMQVPEDYYEKFADAELAMRNRDPERENLEHTRAALAMVENIDWNVGRVLKALDDRQLADNTIVIYMSDNGPNGSRWNDGMKGRKGSLDEGGVRVPALWRWPGRIAPGSTVDRIAAAVDILPTLAAAAEISTVGDKPLDGKSMLALLMGSSEPWPDRNLFAFHRGKISVRTQQYRFDSEGRLFDIPADPGQEQDVAADRPHVATHLADLASSMAAEVEGYQDDDRAFPVGHAASTWLPARDGIASGDIERSNRFPNSSYFRNWTSTDGSVSWDIEVEQPGVFEVFVRYTCPPADIGSTVVTEFLGQSMTARVEKAHDSVEIGAAEDRVPRIESYIKDFANISFGEIELSAGRGPLALRATDIPGSQVMEIAGLTLVRLGNDAER